MKTMTILILRDGGVKCSRECKFYHDCGYVPTPNGPLKTHCGMTTQKVVVDCDSYNPDFEWIEDVTEEELDTVLVALGRQARKQRKEFTKEHKEIHPIGWTPSRSHPSHID